MGTLEEKRAYLEETKSRLYEYLAAKGYPVTAAMPFRAVVELLKPEEGFSPFKFVQVSDTHYQYSQEATAVVVANINALSDVDFVTNSGDLTLDQTKDDTVKAAELAEYKANLRDVLDVPIYPCVGGHDLCDSMATIWPEYTGTERLHELVHKDCVFLFADCLLTGWLDWLEAKVANHTGKRIFIFEHHPIENDEFAVGLKDGETRVTWGDTDMQRILRLLRNNHNIIWFTGHTHWPFGTAVNDVYSENGLMGAIVHTPYINAYQGWEVDVGETSTVLKGVSFSEAGMAYLGDGYNYTIEQGTTDYGEAEIITEGETVEVGGETSISVYLATAPAGNQIVNVAANDAISASVDSITFTPQNYNVPQTIMVEGVSEGLGRLVLYSQSKTTVRKVDVVAGGSAIINWFNKDKPLTLLGKYYGTAGSASYQLSNLIPAKTGDTVKSTALGSTVSKRLRMFDANFNFVAENGGNSTIDYTIAEEGVEYVSVVYRGADASVPATIVVTVNQDLPSEYIAYNGTPVGYVFTNYADMENPTLTDAIYNGSLVETTQSGINVSNIIPCVPGDTVYWNNMNTNVKYVYLYDANKTIIERSTIQTIENENAAYFAVTYKNSATDLMIMKNQGVPGYYVADTDTM